MNTLKNLFLDQLGEMYAAEQQIAWALPRIIHSAQNERLQDDLQAELYETRGHAARVAKVFACFSAQPAAPRSNAVIAGLLTETDTMITDFGSSPAIDAVIIASLQKIEHYEMATYGCLRDWARLLGNTEAERQLQRILNEEKAVDHRLTERSRHGNISALEEAETTVLSNSRN